MKRLISANTSEMLAMNAAELKQSIKASEGRVILSENVATRETYIGDITNAEIARAFGADLILLNCVDVLEPDIYGLEHDKDNFVSELHRLVGRPIGVQNIVTLFSYISVSVQEKIRLVHRRYPQRISKSSEGILRSLTLIFARS